MSEAAFDPKSWQPILHDSFHPPSVHRLVAREVIPAAPDLHRSFNAEVPDWRWPLWVSGLDAVAGMAQKSGAEWRTERQFGDDWGRPGPPEFGSIQVGPKDTRTALMAGGAVVAYERGGETRRLVLSIHPVMGGRRVSLVGTDAQREDAERLFRDIGDWAVAHNFFKGQKVDPFGGFLELDDVDEADLVLAPGLKEELFRNVAQMIERAPEYARFGIPAKRGIIMAGPPGCGKTLSMRVLAKRLPCSFVWVTPRHLQKLDGLAHVYDFAREIAPSVVLLEDADAFGIDRRLGQFSPVLGELLGILDGVVANKGVITILSSNYAEVLDSALTRRPGRFDVKLHFNPPGGPEAFEMLRRTVERRHVALAGDPESLRKAAFALAEHHASGAHVVEVANYASMLAVERGRGKGARLVLDRQDIEDATKRVLASLGVEAETEKALADEGVLKWGGWTDRRR